MNLRKSTSVLGLLLIANALAFGQEKKSIDFKEKTSFVLGKNNENTLVFEDGATKVIPNQFRAIIKLSPNKYLVSAREEEKQEQLRYYDLQILDKNLSATASADNLSKYVVLLNVGGINIAKSKNENYVEIFDPETSTYNYVDQNGKKQFATDLPYGSSVLFDDYLLLADKNVSNTKYVYQISTKKSIQFPKNWQYYSTLNHRKKAVLHNSTDQSYALFDLASNKILFTSKGYISELKNGRDEILENHLTSKISDNEIQTLDNLGNVIISGNFYPKAYEGENIVFFENGSQQRSNVFDVKTKAFKYSKFISGSKETDQLSIFKYDQNYIVVKKRDNTQLFGEGDYVKSYDVTGNMVLLRKQAPGQSLSGVAEIFGNKKDEIIFKDVTSINYIDGTSQYFAVSAKNGNRFIVDADGEIIVPEQKMEYGKISFSKGTFEIKNHKGKVLQTLARQ